MTSSLVISISGPSGAGKSSLMEGTKYYIRL